MFEILAVVLISSPISSLCGSVSLSLSCECVCVFCIMSHKYVSVSLSSECVNVFSPLDAGGRASGSHRVCDEVLHVYGMPQSFLEGPQI